MLRDSDFDVVVVGGGIFGACAAWDATLRGLRVALVEANDFASGTSANSYKMIHGGIRYMQHLDLVRVRSSCNERSAFLRIAPHLVQPLPTLIPTFGYGTSGKAFLSAGMFAYDVATMDRNRGIPDARRRIPWSRPVSRAHVLEHFPGLPDSALTGAAVFCDAQMYNPTRLVLAFIQSAAARGAVVLNYARAGEIQVSNGKVSGCSVEDTLTGETIPVKTRAVLNAAGPWAESILEKQGLAPARERPPAYSRDSCFLIKRRFDSDYALAVPGASTDSDALVSRGARHLFLVPWRQYTLVGVWHKVWDQSPDDVAFDPRSLSVHIREINAAFPGLNLSERDVLMWNAGLLPFGDQDDDHSDLSFGKRSILIDHEKEHDIAGLVTLIGVRYTMGRGDAERAVDLVQRQLGSKARRAGTERIAIHGGDIPSFNGLVDRAAVRAGRELPRSTIAALVHNHGTHYSNVLDLGEACGVGFATVPGTTSLRAEVVNAVRNEMAIGLADVVFRRTDIGTAGWPGAAALADCADLMAAELSWDTATRQAQLLDALRHFPVKADGGMPTDSRVEDRKAVQ